LIAPFITSITWTKQWYKNSLKSKEDFSCIN